MWLAPTSTVVAVVEAVRVALEEPREEAVQLCLRNLGVPYSWETAASVTATAMPAVHYRVPLLRGGDLWWWRGDVTLWASVRGGPAWSFGATPRRQDVGACLRGGP